MSLALLYEQGMPEMPHCCRSFSGTCWIHLWLCF